MQPPPPWKRRPIFLWQLRLLIFLLIATVLFQLPQTSLPTSLPNPCLNRPTPPPLPPSTPPTLFFPHIPQTPSSSLYTLLSQFANRTGGLSCYYPISGGFSGLASYTANNDTLPSDPLGAATLAAVVRGQEQVKDRLVKQGGCRSLYGEVPAAFGQRVENGTAVLTVLLLRDAVDRFVSWWEFARGVREERGWGKWLTAESLAKEFSNSTSVLHTGFVDLGGKWENDDVGELSFGFWGGLYVVSGVLPRFEGKGDPFYFGAANGAEMRERGMDKVCRSHVVGVVADMTGFWGEFFGRVGRWVEWSEDEKRVVVNAGVKKGGGRLSRNVDDHLPSRIREVLEWRLRDEIELVRFAEKVVEYRKWLREAVQ